MKRLSYSMLSHLLLALGAVCLLPCCSEDARGDDVQAGVLHEPAIFRQGSLQKPYSPPQPDAWAERYLSHLETGTLKAHRFALERIANLGPEAAPAIVAEIKANMARSAMGYLVNLCAALGVCENPEGSEVLLDLLEQGHPPVVRTAACETLGRLLPPGQDGRLRQLVEKETEFAPHAAGLLALARYGTPEAIAYLLQGAHQWLDSAGAHQAGQASWKALLLVETPGAAFALQELEPKLAPFPSLQAYGVRIDLGERDLADRILPYLDAERYPSSSTRELALQLLGELGAWDSVLGAREDPAPGMQFTLVGLLRRPDAAAAGVGLDLLEEYAENAPDPDLRFQALLGLLERGLSNRLDPYLRLAREFPIGKGSVEAVRLLGKEGVADERVASILLERWPYAQGGHRSDLLKVLTRTQSPQAARFLLERALDLEEDPSMRRSAAILLGNFGVQSVPMLVRLWREQPGLETAQVVVSRLGRFVDHPDARALLLELASSAEVDDRVRRATLENFPQIFKQDAFQILMDISEAEPRVEIVRFIEGILSEYF